MRHSRAANGELGEKACKRLFDVFFQTSSSVQTPVFNNQYSIFMLSPFGKSSQNDRLYAFEHSLLMSDSMANILKAAVALR